MRHVILTGATGNFGQVLFEKLVKEQISLTLLVRAESLNEAKKRLRYDRFDQDQVEIISVNLLQTSLGLPDSLRKNLAKKTTHILHAAASTRFTLPLEEARRNNVVPTTNLLTFAHECPKLNSFGFISSAFVAGKRIGEIRETELEHTEGFLNTYEQSKYEAEVLVQANRDSLPITVYRPSFLLTATPGKGVVNALRFCIQLALKGMLPILPGTPESRLDILPANFATEVLYSLFVSPNAPLQTYQIVAGQYAMKISEIISSVEQGYQKQLPITFGGNSTDYTAELKRITRNKPHLALLYRKLNTFLPELCYPKYFADTNVQQVLPDINIPPYPLDSFFNPVSPK